jgi:hypothetical protein
MQDDTKEKDGGVEDGLRGEEVVCCHRRGVSGEDIYDHINISVYYSP